MFVIIAWDGKRGASGGVADMRGVAASWQELEQRVQALEPPMGRYDRGEIWALEGDVLRVVAVWHGGGELRIRRGDYEICIQQYGTLRSGWYAATEDGNVCTEGDKMERIFS